MQRNTLLLITALLPLVFDGCKRLPDRPEGMPQLTPCTIEVTSGNERLAEVSVLLIPTDTGGWQAGGKTDTEGKAVMVTAAYYTGVVPGEYIVSFEKYAPVEIRSDGMPFPAKPLVLLKYSQRQSQEIITVTKNQTVYHFELDKM